jgi:hypothetical protein
MQIECQNRGQNIQPIVISIRSYTKFEPFHGTACEGEDIGDYAIKKLGLKSDFLGNNRIIWEKSDFLVKKSDYLGKNRIIWEKIGFFGK